MMHKIIQEDIELIIGKKLSWENFDGATVLISGANGLIPAYMVETLLYLNERFNKNIKVIALVRNKEKALKRFFHHENRNDLKFIFQDVCDPIMIGRNEKIDFVIHAASQASPRYYGVDPVGTLNANIFGTSNLLKLAKEKNCKGFLFFSSSEVYGEMNESQIPTKESDFGFVNPANVRSCYAESKRMGETICISWLHQYGVPVKIVRPFHTYGPGMNLNDGRVFADFISDIVNNRNIEMKSDGLATRAFCYLADAVAGFFTVFLNGKIGEAYNVGSSTETSIIGLADILVVLYPEKKLKVIRRESDLSNGYLKSKINRSCPDINKINQLGWFPVIKFDEGFKRTITSFL